MPQPKDFKRKLPPPRVERHDPTHLDDGEGNLWAVSYSDLLMVLMSFFVIYFSFDNSSSAKNGILQIALDMRGTHMQQKAATPAGVGAGQTDGQTGTGQPGGLNAALHKKFENTNVRIDTPGNSLVIHFDQDIFPLGKFALSAETKKYLSEVLDLLDPYKDLVEIIVIGHSDAAQVRKKPGNQYLENNFDLSSLRALKGLQYMIDKGFPHDQISAQGTGENVRSSRTLSLRIQLRGKNT